MRTNMHLIFVCVKWEKTVNTSYSKRLILA